MGNLPYRSECKCGCHKHPGMMHITACCQPDPRMTPPNDAPVAVEQCPFCGGRAQLDRYDPDPANPEMAVNCMGECDGIFIFPKIAAGDTVALVQRWNTRLAALASASAPSWSETPEHIREHLALLAEVELHLKSSRVFVTTREKMHPCGVELHDELLGKVTAAIETIGKGQAHG